MPGWLPASSTTAPAPSPNRTQVPRSFQSMMREKTSVPTTSAQRVEPERINLSATVMAYTKPVQTACKSKAGLELATPSLRCKIAAVLGNIMSGVDVATIIRSTSSADLPAASSAWEQASVARSLAETVESARYRMRIPVRSMIHSSDDSRPCRLISSALLNGEPGRKLPVPVMRE